MIGEKLKRLRTSKGLTQTELGRIAGISYIQIGRYEKNTSNPTSRIFKKLADALEVDTNYFFANPSADIDIKIVDEKYKKLRTLIDDNTNQMITVKELFEALIERNEMRRKYS